MNKLLKFITLPVLVMLLTAFNPMDNKVLLTGGTVKTWRLAYFLFDGYDFTDSVACIKNLEVSFAQNNTFTSHSLCPNNIENGGYAISFDEIIIHNDTFILDELSEQKLKYSLQTTAMTKISGEDFVEIPHRLTFLFYAKD